MRGLKESQENSTVSYEENKARSVKAAVATYVATKLTVVQGAAEFSAIELLARPIVAFVPAEHMLPMDILGGLPKLSRGLSPYKWRFRSVAAA